VRSWFGFNTHYATWELRVMRLFFAVLVFWRLDRPAVAEAPHPHGIANLVDLTFLADPWVFTVLKSFLVVPLILFVWGRWMTVSLTLILAAMIGTQTLNQSQGAIGHRSQIVGLVLLALWLAYLVGPRLRRSRGTWWRADLTVDDLGIYWAQQMIAAAYCVAGITKLAVTGFQLVPLAPRWILNVQYIPVQITKTHEEAYYTAFDPEMLDRGRFLAELFVQNPDLTRLFFSGGLVLELFAFLLLMGRRWAAGMGVALIGMHMMIALTMHLHFWENVFVAAIFLVNVPYWLAVLGRTHESRWSRPTLETATQ
jgi:hypothetical protein